MNAWKASIILLNLIPFFTETAASDSTLTDRTDFVSGCAQAIVDPAKRDYATAAEKSGIMNPKPFPEELVRESAEPFCACFADRLEKAGIAYTDAVQTQAAAQELAQDVASGGQCIDELRYLVEGFKRAAGKE